MAINRGRALEVCIYYNSTWFALSLKLDAGLVEIGEKRGGGSGTKTARKRRKLHVMYVQAGTMCQAVDV